MRPGSAEHGGLSTVSWVRTTTIGWFLGFLIMLVLIFIGETIGASGQSMVGVGIAAGVGYWQSRLLRGVLDRTRRWVWATAVGMGIPFVLWDLSVAVGRDILFSSSLPVCVITGGLLVALWQWRLLRPRSDRAAWWIPACTIGWALPALAISLSGADAIPIPWSELVGLAGMFFGGTMLGGATARPLIWILCDAPAPPKRSSPGT